jgi:VanZ family protein
MRWITQVFCGLALIVCLLTSTQTRLDAESAGAWVVAGVVFGVLMIVNTNIREN